MEPWKIILTIVFMAIVTVLPRILPVWVLSGVRYPGGLTVWLKYVPVAVVSAMLGPELLLRDGKFDLGFSNEFFWLALPTFVVAVVTKNLFATILTGMGGLALVRFFLG